LWQHGENGKHSELSPRWAWTLCRALKSCPQIGKVLSRNNRVVSNTNCVTTKTFCGKWPPTVFQRIHKTSEFQKLGNVLWPLTVPVVSMGGYIRKRLFGSSLELVWGWGPRPSSAEPSFLTKIFRRRLQAGRDKDVASECEPRRQTFDVKPNAKDSNRSCIYRRGYSEEGRFTVVVCRCCLVMSHPSLSLARAMKK